MDVSYNQFQNNCSSVKLQLAYNQTLQVIKFAYSAKLWAS